MLEAGGLPWELAQLLEAGRPSGVRVSVEDAPAGSRVLDSYVPVPSLRRLRFLVPDADPRLAAATLSRYNALRPLRARMARGLLAAGFRTGLASRAWRQRLVVSVPEGWSIDDETGASLLSHLRVVLDRPALVAGLGVHGFDPHHKPTLQLFDAPGVPVGYAKVGCSPATNAFVQRETTVLQALADATPDRLRFPRPLWSGNWRHHNVLVTSPLPERVRRWNGPSPPLEPLYELSRLWGHETTELSASRYWGELLSRVERVRSNPESAHLGYLAEWVTHAVERSIHGRRLTFGGWHGDWVPWNLATCDGQLWVWDWEHSTESVPFGFDALHWYFQKSFVLHGGPLAEGATAVDNAGTAVLPQLGISPDVAPAVCTLYLLEMCLRSWSLKMESGSWQERMYPAMLGLLADRATTLLWTR